MTATYAEVLRCFADRRNPQAVIDRLTAEWAQRYGAGGKVGPGCDVWRERWTHEQVGQHLDQLAEMVPALITEQPPRRLDGPLVLVYFGYGRIGQIDGRRRANVWRHMPGEYEVLIVCAS